MEKYSQHTEKLHLRNQSDCYFELNPIRTGIVAHHVEYPGLAINTKR